MSGIYHHPNRMYAANQIGVATTLPHSSEALHVQQNMSASAEADRGHSAHSTHSQDDRFSHRDTNVTGSEVGEQELRSYNVYFLLGFILLLDSHFYLLPLF